MSQPIRGHQAAAVIGALAAAALYVHAAHASTVEHLLLGACLAVLATAPRLAVDRHASILHDRLAQVDAETHALRDELHRHAVASATNVATAVRLAREEGVRDGMLRARLGRDDAEPPRPRLRGIRGEGMAS